MKNSLAYVLIFISISFFNIINSSGNKIFKEDCDQEKGLIVLNSLYKSFNNFEFFFNKFKEYEDILKVIPISKNRIEIALRSAELTKKLEEKWDVEDKTILSPRKIQKAVWENSEIYLIPYYLDRLEKSNIFDQNTWDIEIENKSEKTQQCSLIKSHSNDECYQKFYMDQIYLLKKLKEITNVSGTPNAEKLSKNFNHKEISHSIGNQKISLFNKLKNLQALADEMVKIYFN